MDSSRDYWKMGVSAVVLGQPRHRSCRADRDCRRGTIGAIEARLAARLQRPVRPGHFANRSTGFSSKTFVAWTNQVDTPNRGRGLEPEKKCAEGESEPTPTIHPRAAQFRFELENPIRPILIGFFPQSAGAGYLHSIQPCRRLIVTARPRIRRERRSRRSHQHSRAYRVIQPLRLRSVATPSAGEAELKQLDDLAYQRDPRVGAHTGVGEGRLGKLVQGVLEFRARNAQLG